MPGATRGVGRGGRLLSDRDAARRERRGDLRGPRAAGGVATRRRLLSQSGDARRVEAEDGSAATGEGGS